jgi:hypothetical protein
VGHGEGTRRSVGSTVGWLRPAHGGSGRAARARVTGAKQGRGGSLMSGPEATAGFKPGQPSQKSFKQN